MRSKLRRPVTAGSIVIHLVFLCYSAVIIIPFLLIFSVSLSEEDLIFMNGYSLLPQGLNLQAYTREGELINVIPDGGYQPFTSWEFGNMANCYIASGNWPAGGEEVREDGLTVANGMWYDLNQNVEGSPLLGFVFDAEPIKSEIANCQAVIDQLYYSISCGSVDPETYIPQFNDQLRSAGLEKVLAEKQKQLDAWKASK